MISVFKKRSTTTFLQKLIHQALILFFKITINTRYINDFVISKAVT